jgi:hypothetical protein
MGFDPISVLSLGAGVVGAVNQADAAGEAAKTQQAASAKAVADAAALVQNQKLDQQKTLALSGAFNSLATYQAAHAGSASTQFGGR